MGHGRTGGIKQIVEWKLFERRGERQLRHTGLDRDENSAVAIIRVRARRWLASVRDPSIKIPAEPASVAAISFLTRRHVARVSV